MIPMTLLRVQKQEKRLSTIVTLLDQSQQRVALLLWFIYERDASALHMITSTEQKAIATELLTTDFIMNILQVLDGTIEGIEIDTLQTDILYARVKLHSPAGVQHTIKARLENALPLAIESHCPINVAEEILEHHGIKLEESSETFEQQLDDVIQQGQQIYRHGMSQAISVAKVPRNLDFQDDLRGWSLAGNPGASDYYEYQVDTTTTFKKKASLAITLRAREQMAREISSGNSVSLTHEGFIAHNYQGKRLRMLVYVRAEQVKHGVFRLHITGPIQKGERAQSLYLTSNEHEPIEGTSDWRRYELVIDVPEDAISIKCSFSLRDSGKVWLNGLQFEEVDTSVPLTGTRIMPPPRQPVNLTFAQNFDGWIIAGNSPQDYIHGIEPMEQETSQVAYLKNAKEQPRGKIILQQFVNAYNYLGKTVRLTAMLRAEDIIQQGSLYLTQGFTDTNNMRVERTIQGTVDWQKYDMTLEIPNEPSQIEFGLTLYGSGQIWLRDVQFLALQD